MDTVLFTRTGRRALVVVLGYYLNHPSAPKQGYRITHLIHLSVCMDMTFVGHKSLRVIVIYRPPDCTTSALFSEEFSSLLEEITLCHQELLIWGDFNIHIDDSSNGMGNQFIDLLSLFNLT